MLNHKLVRKTHPLPRIGENMQKPEGFQYSTALDLNMGYYTIRIYSASQDMTIIVTAFGKFRYNCIPMGMGPSGDILQDIVDKLLDDIEDAKTYIYNILVLGKYYFTMHI